MINLQFHSIEFKIPLKDSKNLSIIVQFPNHVKKSTQPFYYDASKNYGLINQLLKCDEIILNSEEDLATLEIDEEEGDDIIMPKKQRLLGKQLIKLKNVQQGTYQLTLNQNLAKIKYSCSFGLSRNSSITQIPTNKKKYMTEEEDITTSDQNDILSLNRNLASIHDRKNLIQVQKKNLNQIDDEYIFDESMIDKSKRDVSILRINTSVSTDYGQNNSINPINQNKNKALMYQQTQYQTAPLSPIASSRDLQSIKQSNQFQELETSYQYVPQKEQLAQNTILFTNYAKILISLIQFLKQVYSWDNAILSVGYGVGVTMFLTYYNMSLIISFVLIYKFPQIIEQQLYYKNNECPEEDLYNWNKFCEDFAKYMQNIKENINSNQSRETLFTAFIYILVLVIMNSIFSVSKMFILLFWIHLFSYNYNGYKICKVFHYEIFGPVIDQAYQLISKRANLESDEIPDENVQNHHPEVYKPFINNKPEDIQLYEVYENQRIVSGLSWQPCQSNERFPWSNEDGRQQLSKNSTQMLNERQKWLESEWQIDINEFTDVYGWEYAKSFNEGVYQKTFKSEHQVRRRRWIRKAIYSSKTQL
ncbi:transmembrane protein, putative (macronuclear) [Tetrahymena thermophila SB210]|uniref:Transmembrane protein, putative n=1 Tax=Tetrahymena thermophila (strain SB210) TaxID=312017 RepID=Q23RV0_TETTS|nr:transmembrane protein, putative [Tetrahymena thermophila SB210]EAR99289.2 transmembrane protein, putative [Tetrahymena thermophila SB210]|eukprot:XP_001019534.2 transmembrane protein, putative [Tetrahymena thermophila SB210]